MMPVAIGHDAFFVRMKAAVRVQTEFGTQYRCSEVSYPRSLNPYGFIRVTIPPGDSMLSNPLNTRTNTLTGLMPNVPDGTYFHKWIDTLQGYEVSSFFTGYGWLPDQSLLPGEGGIIQNLTDEPFTVTFIGEVLQGHLVNSIPSGIRIRSSMVPQAGGITTRLGFGPEDGLANGDSIQLLRNVCGDYAIYTWNGSWSRTQPQPVKPWEPRPAIAEAFWINPQGPRTWTRNFWVWP